MNKDMRIVYYSRQGNTRKIAEQIKCGTGGELFEIKPVQPYTTDDNAVVEQAKKQIRSGFRPELKSMPETASYNIVFIGSPIRWHTMAPTPASFIDRVDLGSQALSATLDTLKKTNIGFSAPDRTRRIHGLSAGGVTLTLLRVMSAGYKSNIRRKHNE